MRSHVCAKLQPQPPPSLSLSASFSEEVAEVAERESPASMEENAQFVNYGLRENPRKSFRLVDPEFSSIFPPVDPSIILQDRESETESSKPPSVCRRSKRRRRSPVPPLEPYFDPEPVSSVSNTTPEEDVARCLMMLSRDSWTNDSSPEKKPKNFNRLTDDLSEEELTTMAKSRRRTKYRCGTCRKVFRSYQALGGHRASHKNLRTCVPPTQNEEEEEEYEDAERGVENQIQEVDSELNFASSTGERKIHECPVCFRVFGSGQALGGHKRSHLVNSPVKAATKKITTKVASSLPLVHRESFIDLNLPPPDEEGELSAVFDSEQ